MLLTVTPLEDPGPPSPAPPPTAPKPPKDNARLQRLLRKAAKRSGVQQSSTQPPKSFRSTLSPVNEGDIESPEPSASKKYEPPPLNLPPRFQIRSVTHRVPSPYPKHRSFTFTVSEQQSLSQYLCSPPPCDTPSPLPPGTRSPDAPTPYPPQASTPVTPTPVSLGANIPNTLTKHLPANKTPDSPLKACSSQDTPPPFTHGLSTSPTPLSPSASDHPATPVISLPVAIQKTGGPHWPKTEDKMNESQSETGVRNTDNGYCISKPRHVEPTVQTSCLKTVDAGQTSKSPLPVLEEISKKDSSCCSPTSNITSALQLVESPKQLTTENSESGLPFSASADVPCPTSTLASGPTNTTDTTSFVSAVNVQIAPSPVVLEATQSTLKSPTIMKNIPVISVTEVLPAKEEICLLKNPERARPPRRKPGGGWARLVKHLIVEPEEPKFPEDQSAEVKDEKAGDERGQVTESPQQSRGNRANKMWDALLYHMATSNKVQEKASSEPTPPLPFLRSRLPLLLHRPRFDARKLKEAASRPLRRVSAFFHRRVSEKTVSTFNRTASGWSIREEESVKEGAGEGQTTM
ncbi:proline-rich protein 33 [Rhinophrynus dorsalis]